jgi:hypothetical protein
LSLDRRIGLFIGFVRRSDGFHPSPVAKWPQLPAARKIATCDVWATCRKSPPEICQIAGFDDAVPFVDARLPDGSRAHAVLGCLASPGICISLRVPAQRTFSLQDCVASGALTSGAAQLLTRMIEAKLAFLISGGTGSGKTTLRLRHY